jgi:Ni,Fe-hydrogenase III component G
MRTTDTPLEFRPLPGAAPAGVCTVGDDWWSTVADAFAEAGTRLVALWGTDRRDLGEGFVVYAAYAADDGLACVRLPLGDERPEYPDLSARFPAATRMQRAAFDLLGIRARGAEDQRPWLRHGAWPADFHPLRRDSDGARRFDPSSRSATSSSPSPATACTRSRSGPSTPASSSRATSASRSSAKGAAPRGAPRLRAQGHREALRGHAAGRGPPARRPGVRRFDRCLRLGLCDGGRVGARLRRAERAAWLRALLLERERVANHLGDLGALGNDAALAFGLAQFSRLRNCGCAPTARSSATAADGPHRPRRRRGRSIDGGAARSLRRSATRSRRGAPAARDLRRARRPAGPLPDHRHGVAGAGGAARPGRSRRSRQRPGARPARRPPLPALRPAARAASPATAAATSRRGLPSASTRCSSRCA